MRTGIGRTYLCWATAACLLAGLPCAQAVADDSTDLRQEAFANLWNEHADRAVTQFGTWLRNHPDDRDPDTLRGLALALSWYGLQRRAERVYLELIAADAADGDARIGLARARIWDNRLREGWRDLRAVETDQTLDAATRREAGDFALRVLDEYTPTAQITWRGNWDSDDLDIQRLSALGAATIAHGILVQTGPRLSYYTQPGRPDVTALRWQALAVTGLTPHLSLHAQGWFEHFGSSGPLAGSTDKLDWNRPGADAWLTWQPVSRLRLDGGAASQPVETYLAFAHKIGFTQENLSGDWRLTRRLALGASGTRAVYSDGNRRLQGRLQAVWHYEGPLDLDLTASFTHLDFTRPYPGGYWSPDWVRNGSLAARAKWYGRRWTLTLEGSVGLETEAGAEGITVGGGSGRVGLRVSDRWLIALEAGHSRSSFSTASGYHRTFAGLSLRGVF